MGLYIPPTGGSNGSDKNNSDDKKTVLRSGDDKFLFYTRPSVGLKIWGPLVPASDFLPGLYALTGLQTLLGFVMFKNVKAIWRNKTVFARFSKTLSTLAGGYLIFNSGLEVSRLTLPYDPWYDEAKEVRESAARKGQKPNFWFGPWDFKPMNFQQWNEKVDKWILDTEDKLERGEKVTFESSSNSGINHNSNNKFILAGPEFHEVYLQIRQANKQRHSQVLEQLENKSFKDILPNYQSYANPRFERPTISIPEDNELKDDYDLEEAWELNDPWVSLGHDTDYIVRFIPKFRWIDSIEQHQRQIQEYQDSLAEEEHL